MTDKMSSTSEHKIIELVRDCPALYEKTHPDYKNAVKKESHWREIAAKLEGVTGAEVKTKWTALRNQFKGFLRRLSKPSGSEGGPRPFYRHESAMSFLKGTTDNNESTSSNLDNFGLDTQGNTLDTQGNTLDTQGNTLDNHGDEDEVELDESEDGVSVADKQSTSQLVPRSKEIPPGRSHAKFSGKRKVDPFEKELLGMLKTDEDEYDSYAKMIAPKLRRLSKVDRKLLLNVQYDINSIIHRAEMDSLDSADQ